MSKIPGFRSGKRWKKVLSSIVYALITLIIISVATNSGNKGTSPPINVPIKPDTVKVQTTQPAPSASTPAPVPAPVTPTTTPTPSSTSTSTDESPKPITLSGSGQQASSKFILSSGLSVFKMTHSGSGNFAVELLDSNGKTVELLANTIGSFNGSKAVGIQSNGTYLLNITASGKWTVTIEQPRPTSAPNVTDFSGKSQTATQLFTLSAGLKTFQMTHSGDGNFAPVLLNRDGKVVDLLANEIGHFNGSKAKSIPRDGIYILDVTANGPWTIKIQ